MTPTPTECPHCTAAEAPPIKLRQQALVFALALIAPRPSPATIALQGYTGAMRAALGIREPTWYERHRENWVRDGEMIELERMARHVRV